MNKEELDQALDFINNPDGDLNTLIPQHYYKIFFLST